ncbi:transglutaminase domain-containing protein [Ilyomonas limi]|nr:transglutaminase domain-containing protein [Ilyomonas limi]
MKNYGFFILIITLFLSFSAPAQSYDLQETEQFIQAQKIEVSSSKDLDVLAQKIITQYPDSLSRVKAAYLWVAKNITYNEEGNGPQHYASNIDSVLKYKTTVCAGYVNVFVMLCERLGITAKEVDGYGKTGTQVLPNDKFTSNHSWAAVWLNGKWNLTDVTWGSGYTLEGTHTFTRKSNGWYFFTEPEVFILDHYPKKGQWQLLKDTVSWDDFISYANIGLGAKENDISSYAPMQAVIHSAVGKQVVFSFTTKKDLSTILLTSKQKGFQELGTLAKRGDTYYYSYKIPYDGQYDLQIDLSDVDRTKPGNYSSMVDFSYFVVATANREEVKR